MDIGFADYEAIAALKYGTLEDWAFESAEHFTTDNIEVNLFVSAIVSSEAIIKMMS